MTCEFEKQNDIIKCKCDVVMATDLGNLQSDPESISCGNLSQITSQFSWGKRKKRETSLMW